MTNQDQAAADEYMVEWSCKVLGYGRVMQIASELWIKKDPIGALTIGPCVAVVKDQVILSREDAEKIHEALYHYSKYVEQTNGGIKSTKLHDAFDILEAAMKGSKP